MKQAQTKQAKRHHRQARVRARIFGTTVKPRLTVFRSNTGMFVQLIDDEHGKTLASVHSKTVGKVSHEGLTAKAGIGYELGQKIAAKAESLGITTAAFDRAGFRYHGRVKAVADGARAGGLNF